MTKSFRSVLSPLLIISYVCGLKIFEFSAYHPKLWCNLLYMLLLWSIYFRLVIYIKPYMSYYNTIYLIFFWFNIFITLMLVLFKMYYDKKFKKCIKRIDIVDNTLEQFGIKPNYQKLRKKTVWLILGWSMLIIVINYDEAICLKHGHNLNTVIVISVSCVLNYCAYINFIDDLIIISILGYIGLKFDQINDNLQKIMKNNEQGLIQVRKNYVLSCQSRFLKIPSNKYIIWIVIHLHLELCKISREINSMFGLQMTLKVGLYFGFITTGFYEIFHMIFIKTYVQHIRLEYIILIILWIMMNVLKLFLINYICERVSVKANTTGNVITNASYSISDVEFRENILQLLLQLTQAPLKFHGLGLFQFGFKFLQGFFASIASVLIILIQAHTNK